MPIEPPSGDTTGYPRTMTTKFTIIETNIGTSDDPYFDTNNDQTHQPSSNTISQPILYPYALKQGIQEAQVIMQGIIIMLILNVIPSSYSGKRPTWTFWRGSIIIPQIVLHTVYYETSVLLSSTKL